MPSADLSSFRNTLHDGFHRFRSEVFSPRRQEYETAATTPQRPHTLFITCSDSRIDPEAITQSKPGQIFVTRNIGNMVPPYGGMQSSVAAVIEYAVMALGVKQIVVCGHSDCGAMKGLGKRESVKALPQVDRWLENADAALSTLQSRGGEAGPNSLPDLTRENVLLQLNHLRTHPSVAGKLAAGELAMYGWVYDIGAGTVLEYHPHSGRFEAI